VPKVNCSLCESPVNGRSLASPQKLENRIIDLIKADRPEWEGKRGICPTCLEQYRAKKFVGYLEAEYHKLSEIEHSVVSKITRRGRVSKLVNQDFESTMTFGQRIADKVAQFGGSWRFIGLFGGILVVWMGINVLMSQNRQAEKDRLQANQDYEINLMAEIEIRDLHDKMDSLRFKQWHELWHIQKRQIELLEHLCERNANPDLKTPAPTPYVPPEL